MIDINEVWNFIKNHPNSTFINIAKGLKIDVKNNKDLTNVLIMLLDEKKVIQNKNDASYSAIIKIASAQGKIRFASEGRYAFVDDLENEKVIDAKDKKTYFVPGLYLNNAFDEDIVAVDIYKYNENDEKSFAMVTKIIARTQNKIMGILEQGKGFLVFNPINKALKKTTYYICNLIKEARINDIVQAQIVGMKKNAFEIDIVRKISSLSDPMGYVKALTISRNVPEEFPQDVLDYVHNHIPSSIKDESKAGRLDLRNELIVTIDGVDTKDFDDAINVKKLDNDNYELGVHIADVSHYVKENTSLDDEALKRGTSIYLANSVIPMLPTELSNGICSLNPNEDRFAISCIMKIDNKGNTINVNIQPSIIESKYRLTYDRVNELINNNKKFDDDNLNQMLYKAVELAKIIRAYKVSEGYIDFEIEEPYIKMDSEGKVLDIYFKPSGFSENLIEDFMVRANESVASFLAKKHLPLLYRVHEKPDGEKLDYFIDVLESLGIHVNIDRSKITPKTFQKIIEAIKAQRNDNFLKGLFLRTMQKAIYSPENIGHFGLASQFYCHFTSPIRRYPDLIVHRILRDLVFENHRDRIKHYQQILPTYGIENSNSEQYAMDLERDTNDLKFAEFYKNKIGQRYKAQITSIMKFGMFVEFENKTEALIHISTLCNGEYVPNEKCTELKSKNHKFVLGQMVDVIIAGADESTGKVDAVLAQCYPLYLKQLKDKMNDNNRMNNGRRNNHGKRK